jgi:hypothetical protein
MTIRPRGSRFMVDVKVRADQNPTGHPVRVRVSARTREEGERLEEVIRRDVMLYGRYALEARGRARLAARPVDLEMLAADIDELERRAGDLRAFLDRFMRRARTFRMAARSGTEHPRN